MRRQPDREVADDRREMMSLRALLEMAPDADLSCLADRLCRPAAHGARGRRAHGRSLWREDRRASGAAQRLPRPSVGWTAALSIVPAPSSFAFPGSEKARTSQVSWSRAACRLRRHLFEGSRERDGREGAHGGDPSRAAALDPSLPGRWPGGRRGEARKGDGQEAVAGKPTCTGEQRRRSPTRSVDDPVKAPRRSADRRPLRRMDRWRCHRWG